jgi:hypothetical protein
LRKCNLELFDYLVFLAVLALHDADEDDACEDEASDDDGCDDAEENSGGFGIDAVVWVDLVVLVYIWIGRVPLKKSGTVRKLKGVGEEEQPKQEGFSFHLRINNCRYHKVTFIIVSD